MTLKRGKELEQRVDYTPNLWRALPFLQKDLGLDIFCNGDLIAVIIYGWKHDITKKPVKFWKLLVEVELLLAIPDHGGELSKEAVSRVHKNNY